MNLEYTFYIQATPETIWSIITGPLTADIFYGAHIESTFEIDSAVEYIGPGRDGEQTLHIYGKVLEYVPEKVFKLTSNVGQVYKTDDVIYESVIGYHLEDLGHYTCLKVSHSGWDKKDPSYINTKNNWWLMLSNIKTLAETGKSLIIGLHE